jgi:ABC-2 type transport system ATP-binding protein
MIQVRNLEKYYGTFHALRQVSFDVAQGEIVGLLGPNGAGKTTTMRILTGYMPPTAGEVQIAGFDVFENSLEVRRQIGYLPESVPLYAEMSVRRYLGYMADLHRRSNGSRTARRAAVERAMEACQIADRADTQIGQLSKGLRQRVGLAQAIVHDPEVLILDEPTIGLDPKQIVQVRALIQELGREHTIVLSSHILPEVSQTCSRVLIMHNGRIAATGTPDELTARLQGAQHVLVQVRPPGAESEEIVVEVLRRVEGVTAVQSEREGTYLVTCAARADVRPRLAQAVVQQGWELLELRAVGMSLEDIFIRLTADEGTMDERTMDDEEGAHA